MDEPPVDSSPQDEGRPLSGPQVSSVVEEQCSLAEQPSPLPANTPPDSTTSCRAADTTAPTVKPEEVDRRTSMLSGERTRSEDSAFSPESPVPSLEEPSSADCTTKAARLCPASTTIGPAASQTGESETSGSIVAAGLYQHTCCCT